MAISMGLDPILFPLARQPGKDNAMTGPYDKCVRPGYV
jgi:hypothetical protein